MNMNRAAVQSEYSIAFCNTGENQVDVYDSSHQQFYRVNRYQDETQIRTVEEVQEHNFWYSDNNGELRALVNKYREENAVPKGPKEPPLPKRWRYFCLSTALEEGGQELPIAICNAFTIAEFTRVTVPKILEAYPLKSFKVSEVSFEEFCQLEKESKEQMVTALLDFLSGD